MILNFPNLDTLRLALTGAIVPADIALAPARVSRDPAGRIFIETDGKLSKSCLSSLHQLRVLGSKSHPSQTETVASWLQIVPLNRQTDSPPVSSTATVLFELSSPGMLAVLVGEILRQGNDRQSFRFVNEGSEARALLRVIGPPYYSLLRAVDRLATGGGTVRAYFESSPRVWIELGHTHPLARQIKPADGQIVLIRSPGDWQFLPDGEFRDVYEIVEFPLPNAPRHWTEADAGERIVVPLKLMPGNAADAAEMWIIRSQALERLDAMVRDADDRLTEQLRFAVGTSPNGDRCVVLGVAPTKKSLPVVELEGAMPFKSFWRIPNLFLPVGTRLHPTLRRDIVSKLLAEDRNRRVWLFPGDNGSFVPESIPEDAFRPLSDWVEYVIDNHAIELREWIASSEFDFENYVCTDSGPRPRSDRDKPERERKGPEEVDPPMPKAADKKKGGRKPSATANLPFETTPVAVRQPSEWQVLCDDLERQFREFDGPLDAPERLALWPRLAEANTGIGADRRNEAAICWLNALWERSEFSSDLLEGWSRSEAPEGPMTESELDLRLAVKVPTPAQARAAVSLFLALAARRPLPAGLRSRFPAMQTYLEKKDELLPIRAVWLAAVRLAQLSGADVLGLARTRDRVLNRLLERGLSSEQDLPSFLRFAGDRNSERLRAVSERAADIHRVARGWAERSLKQLSGTSLQDDSGSTLAYLDFLFAYCFAKLGELTAARSLCESSQRIAATFKPTETKGIVANFLVKVFRHKVEDAIAGRPNIGSLPRELLVELDAIGKKGGTTANDPHKLAHYVINRMRQQSEIVEPQEKNNPYAEWMKHGDELKKELAELPKIREPQNLGKRIHELYTHGVKGRATAETRFAVLHDALHLTPRAGYDFSVGMIERVPSAFQEMTATSPGHDLAAKQAELLERAMFLAAHFDKPALVRTLVDEFLGYVHAIPEERRFELVNIVASRCLKSLRKVGLRDEIDRLLRRLQDEILGGQTLEQLKVLYAAKPDVWAEALRTMLNLATGWLTFGLLDRATPILDVARSEILDGSSRISVQKFTNVCRTYVAALGQCPIDVGLPGIVELFEKLEPSRITNTFTTAPYYSRLHLNLIEEVVLAIAGDDSSLSLSGQRWLDEDEHLVRRRIHRDMRELIRDTGV